LVESIPEGLQFPSATAPDNDTNELKELGLAQVRSLDFDRLIGAGILHTKLWVVDSKHLFVGSANMDWRSLTQVKEVGAAVYDCPCLAEDMSKIFQVYWDMGEDNATIPPQWPSEYETQFNHIDPMRLSLNATPSLAYIAVTSTHNYKSCLNVNTISLCRVLPHSSVLMVGPRIWRQSSV